MKSNAALKISSWQKTIPANTPETILGAKIAWRKISDEKGRGVFALVDIKKGDVVEVCPVVPVSKTHIKHNGHARDGYLFDWDADTKGEEHAMPLGYAMLDNHSDTPTLALESDLENYTITITAKRNIKAGEELTWNYSCDLWFDEA